MIGCLERGELPRDKAESLAGELNFYFTAAFGNVGKAPLRAIYAHAAYYQKKISTAVKAALEAIIFLLDHAPRARYQQ